MMEHQIVTDPEALTSASFVPDLAVVFYRPGLEEQLQDAYARLQDAYPQIDVIGCSAESLIDAELPHYYPGRNRRFVFMLLKMPKTHYVLKLLEGGAVPDGLPQKHGTLLLSTDNHEGLEEMIDTLQMKLSSNHVYGAIASGNPGGAESATLFCNGKFVKSGSLLWLIDESAYALDGQSICSFDPVGISLKITAAEGFKILEIENAPALDVIEQIIGPLSSEGLASFDYPMFLGDEKNPDGLPGDAALASLSGIDREEGTLTLMRRPRVGTTLHLALPIDRKTHRERIKTASESLRGCDTAFLFSCSGNWYHWGAMAPIHYMHLSRTLGSAFSGFHGDGEIGPIHNDVSRLQNQSMTLVTLRKKETHHDPV